MIRLKQHIFFPKTEVTFDIYTIHELTLTCVFLYTWSSKFKHVCICCIEAVNICIVKAPPAGAHTFKSYILPSGVVELKYTFGVHDYTFYNLLVYNNVDITPQPHPQHQEKS